MDAKVKILVPIDFSDCARRALAQAHAWARWAPCELHVAHVVDGNVRDRASIEAGALAHGLGELERFAEELRAVAVEPHVIVGHPARAIVELAGRLGVDLIVMGTHGRTGLAHLLMGSVAEGVVRGAPCPVMCVRPGAEAPPPRRPRLLCAVDFSEPARRAFDSAVTLAVRFEGELALLHVGTGGDKQLARWRRDAEALGAQVSTVCVPGAASAQIVGHARAQRCDLIVLGTHERTGLPHLLMGSVAQGVLRAAPCPVVIVCPAAAAAAAAA
jgi:nucleotide-binding universal stress UspA family protein